MTNHPIFTKSVIAMLCITALAITALLTGHNTVVIVSSTAAIAGLGGFIAGKATKPK